MSKYKKKKVRSKIFAVFVLLIIGLCYLGIGVLSNYLSFKIIDDTQCEVNEVSTIITEDYEAVLIATKDKAIQSNILLQTIYGEQAEIGSGTIINEDESFYYAITNNHVLDGNNNVIDSQVVITSDDVSSSFEILKIDLEKDLAYIRFTKENREEILPLNIASNSVLIDSLIVTVGNPYGNMASVNYGKVLRMTYLQELELTRTVIEHDAVLSNGSSGGALLDMYGNLIGINTWELNGLYYAIPVSVINTFLEN